MDPQDADATRILDSLTPVCPRCSGRVLVLMSGLPGTGKSTIAAALQVRTGAALIQSDRVRKLLVGEPSYSHEESARVFGAIHAAVERLLSAGIPAILDATMLTAAERQQPAAIAARTGARLILVRTEAPEQVVRERLAARSAGVRGPDDVSDAGVAVYEQMRARVEPLVDAHLTIDTAHDSASAVDALARQVCADG